MKPNKRPVGANGIDAGEHFTHFPARHNILLRAVCGILLPTRAALPVLPPHSGPDARSKLWRTSSQRVHLERVEGVGTLDGGGRRKGALGGKRIAPREHARGAGDADRRCQCGAKNQ